MFQVISGKVPFYNLDYDTSVVITVINRDERPVIDDTLITDPSAIALLHRIARRCWENSPETRPRMIQVL